MDDLLQTGNIVLGAPILKELGCHTYGYYRYVQTYTFMRKYGRVLRYYVDWDSYLYRMPLCSKAKNPDVLVPDDEQLIPRKEYYVRVLGANKKQAPPPLMGLSGCKPAPLLLSKACLNVMEGLSWQYKPQLNPVRYMAGNNSPVTAPGDYYMYRTAILPDYSPDEVPPYRDFDVVCVPTELDVYDSHGISDPLVLHDSFAQKFTADVVYYEGTLPGDHVGLGTSLLPEYVFTEKAVRLLLALDPDLVFAPAYATDRDPLSLRECWTKDYMARRSAEIALRDYLRKWGKVYDPIRFDREYPQFW